MTMTVRATVGATIVLLSLSPGVCFVTPVTAQTQESSSAPICGRVGSISCAKRQLPLLVVLEGSTPEMRPRFVWVVSEEPFDAVLKEVKELRGQNVCIESFRPRSGSPSDIEINGTSSLRLQGERRRIESRTLTEKIACERGSRGRVPRDLCR
jgi:hypothetical protein